MLRAVLRFCCSAQGYLRKRRGFTSHSFSSLALCKQFARHRRKIKIKQPLFTFSFIDLFIDIFVFSIIRFLIALFFQFFAIKN
jgi:hypothetical protein